MEKIAVISSKGGTGKSTIIINVADLLAEKGKPTLLVDLNPMNASVLVQARKIVKYDPKRNLNDYFTRLVNGGTPELSEYISETKNKFLNVLYSKGDEDHMNRLNDKQIDYFMRQLDAQGKSYEFALMDNAALGNKMVVASMLSTPHRLLVSTDSPDAIESAKNLSRRFVKYTTDIFFTNKLEKLMESKVIQREYPGAIESYDNMITARKNQRDALIYETEVKKFIEGWIKEQEFDIGLVINNVAPMNINAVHSYCKKLDDILSREGIKITPIPDEKRFMIFTEVSEELRKAEVEQRPYVEKVGTFRGAIGRMFGKHMLRKSLEDIAQYYIDLKNNLKK